MSTLPTIDEFYAQYIKPCSPAERVRLLALLAQDVAMIVPQNAKKRSLLEFEGVGADIWNGIDAQEYVNKLRGEWDDRP